MKVQLVNRNPGLAELRKFGGAMLLGFGVLGLVAWYTGPMPHSFAWAGVWRQKLAVVLWALGVCLLAVSFGPRALAKLVYVGWMTAAMQLGAVMTVVLLSILFVVLLPLFALIRFADPLRMRLRPPGESYWEDHKQHESTLERSARPF
jgi:hypothetical protein